MRKGERRVPFEASPKTTAMIDECFLSFSPTLAARFEKEKSLKSE